MVNDSESSARSRWDQELLCLLDRGEREIAAGKGYDLDAVLEEADAVLAPESM